MTIKESVNGYKITKPFVLDGLRVNRQWCVRKIRTFRALRDCQAPEPQAIWNKSLSDMEWQQRADAYFKKDKKSEERGEWICKPKMPQQWFVNYRYGDMNIRMRLGLTSFKHVGIFPEQAENWNFIFDQVKRVGPEAKVLNLFAYTGGATLAAKSAGADVTHVDSVKPVISWARKIWRLPSLTEYVGSWRMH